MPSSAGDSYYQIIERSIVEVRDTAIGTSLARGARFCGSYSGGWFVIARQQAPHHALVNLWTGAARELPDVVRILEATDRGDFADADYPVRIEAATLSAAPRRTEEGSI